MAKKPKEIIISTARSERKKTVPRIAFKKGVPNPNQFKPGESGRTRTKADARPDDERLIGRVLRRRLGDRAPDAHAKAAGLRPGASWAMVIGEKLLDAAANGDIAAIREVAERSEGGKAVNLGIGMHFGGDAGEPGSESSPLVRVVFATADYAKLAEENGLATETPSEAPIIEGKLLSHAAPDDDPALVAARAEAQRAAQRRAEAADDEETESASDGEPKNKPVAVQQQEQALPPLPQGYVYWEKWKIRRYRQNRWKIPDNVVEM